MRNYFNDRGQWQLEAAMRKLRPLGTDGHLGLHNMRVQTVRNHRVIAWGIPERRYLDQGRLESHPLETRPVGHRYESVSLHKRADRVEKRLGGRGNLGFAMLAKWRRFRSERGGHFLFLVQL